jgi:hypothetical protein
MQYVDEQVHVGVDMQGNPQSVFSTVEITAVPCIFVHREAMPKVLEYREMERIAYNQPLRIEHKSI